MRRATFLILFMVASGLGAACGREEYPQSSPDDLVRSAVAMVKNGDTDRLDDLILADSDEMRRMLDGLGVLLKNMQELSKSAAAKFPDDLAKMEAEAAKRAAAGKGNSILSMIASGGPGGGGGGQPDEDALRDLINRLFADPYGWIAENESRLTTELIADDLATVLIDGQPVIPVVGLPLKRESDDKWYVALPTNLPPLSQGMPRTRQQWSILRSVLKVVDNTVVEMREDIDAGKVARLDALAEKAQEKMIFPALLAFAAYGKEMDIRERVDRRAKQFQARQREWAKSRKEKAGEGVSEKLTRAMGQVAPVEIEKLVRKNERQNYEGMSETDFEALGTRWLSESGLTVDLSGDVAATAVDARVEAWEKGRKKKS